MKSSLAEVAQVLVSSSITAQCLSSLEQTLSSVLSKPWQVLQILQILLDQPLLSWDRLRLLRSPSRSYRRVMANSTYGLATLGQDKRYPSPSLLNHKKGILIKIYRCSISSMQGRQPAQYDVAAADAPELTPILHEIEFIYSLHDDLQESHEAGLA